MQPPDDNQRKFQLDTRRYRVSFAMGRFHMRDSATGLETDLAPAHPTRLSAGEAESMVQELRRRAAAAEASPNGMTTPGHQTKQQKALQARQIEMEAAREAKIHPK